MRVPIAALLTVALTAGIATAEANAGQKRAERSAARNAVAGPDREPGHPLEPTHASTPPVPDLTAEPAESDTSDGLQLPFDLSGGIYLFHFAPLSVDGAQARTEVYAFFLDVDREIAEFGLHVQARARDTKLRPFYSSVIWFQEAYGYYQSPLGRLKLGKFYKRLGRFWDNSFFGNLHYFDGHKLDPDFGVALEGSRHLDPRWSVEYSAQFFSFSDGINGALDGRDVESADDQREADTWVGRIAPRLTLSQHLSFAVGASYQNGRIERPGSDNRLKAWAIDAELAYRTGLLYAEIMGQDGQDAPAPPQLDGRAADDVRYWLVGAEYSVGPVTLRYNYSRADYRDADVVDEIHQPGGAVQLTDGFWALLELDYWESNGAVFDRSLNAVLLVRF